MTFWQPQLPTQEVSLEQEETLYQGFFRLSRLHLKHPTFQGGYLSVTREIFQRGHAVAVLLIDPWREALVLIEQFRAGALEAPGGPWLLELVAGMIEEDEALDQVASRETLEETGLQIDAVEPILGYLSSPGGSDEWIHLVYGFVDSTQAGEISGLIAEGEDIRVLTLPMLEVFQLLDQGVLNNGAIIIAVQWLRLHQERILAQGRTRLAPSNPER
ncbi:NUDIX domain-containing protein [Nitrincola tapanii]|uniref:ADP-ribose pyrophosphatase n=1 Tax=Nitrincola tapanii TaxID=1708751 RepID=A0A5A9W919_9GAMM|nr:NUDIX domain-containing protein [Nitrincola tapanii]KAA0876509.1 NUDIX domain-containing protein [Nitrincola tapanii]